MRIDGCRGPVSLSRCATFVGACLVAAVLAEPHVAHAAGKGKGAGGWTGPLSRESSWTAAARLGRVRMKQGDCAGAIDAFDESLRGSIDVTTRRDRGLCHEKLEQPIPAMSDYRAYLTEYPDAPDADGIRQRLAHLEDTATPNAPREERGSATPAPTMGSVSLRTSGGVTSMDSTTAVAQPRNGSLDAVQRWETDESMATSSPLRRGKGFIIGPYVSFRRFTDSNLAWGQTIGLAFRYSLSHVSTIISEFGYSSVNATGNASSLGGLGVFLGYEARFALNPYVTDSIYLGGGLGYEHLREQAIGQVFSTFIPRARIGYRHVFGPALGLEVGADGGYAILQPLDAPSGASSTGSAVVALNVALVLGF